MQYSHPYRAESPPPFLAHILFLRHTNADLAHTTTLARVPRVHPSALSPCPPSLSVGSRNPNLKVKFPRGNGRCRALSLSLSRSICLSLSLSLSVSRARVFRTLALYLPPPPVLLAISTLVLVPYSIRDTFARSPLTSPLASTYPPGQSPNHPAPAIKLITSSGM